MDTNGWTVSFDIAHGPTELSVDEYDDAIDDLLGVLAPYRAALSVAPDQDRFRVTMSLAVDDGDAPVGLAWKLFAEAAGKADMPAGPVVQVHALTFAEQDAELDQSAYPELAGVAELAEMLQVTPQRASELQSRNGFPTPTATLRSGPVWVRSHVREFVDTWARKPGRPRKEAS